MPGLLIQPKKAASLIVAGIAPGHKEGEAEDEAAEKSDYEMALQAASEDILSAISTKDVQLFTLAMRDFHNICDEMKEDEEMDTEENGEAEGQGEM